jgi:hypothetical protein
MTHVTEGTKLASHGLFYMENAGSYPDETGYLENETSPITAIIIVPNEHQPSCFALEEERGEGWKGAGATGPTIKETKPSL